MKAMSKARKEVRDLGMRLVSVSPAQPGQADVSDVQA